MSGWCAFFDESGTHDGARVMCVAGFLFTKDNNLRLNEEWHRVLKEYALPYFHMVDCVHRSGVFSGLTMNQCDQCSRKLIPLIKRYMSFGFVSSIDRNEYFNLMPYHPVMGDAYQCCIWHIFQGIRIWRRKHGNDVRDIIYIFEAGHQSQSKVARNLSEQSQGWSGEANWPGYAGHEFRGKQGCAGLQAADILAWQFAKLAKSGQEKRAHRKDMLALVENQNHLYYINGMDGAYILSLISRMLATDAWGDLQATGELCS